MNNFKHLLFIVLTLFCSLSSANLRVDSSLAQVKSTMTARGEKKGEVWILSQWHLSPQTETRDIEKSKILPQYLNQKSLFLQIDKWIKESGLKTVIAEGCEGEITNSFSNKFNGWGYSDLSRRAEDISYVDILTHIPLKFEAKYKDQIRTLCGDSLELIQKSQLALSEVRGLMGFYSRLEEFKLDPKKSEPYLAKVRQLLNLKPTTSNKDARQFLKLQMQLQMPKFFTRIEERNQLFSEAVIRAGDKVQVVVIGGLHSEGLAKILRSKGYTAHIVVPVGYHEDVEKDIQGLSAFINEKVTQ